MFQIEPLMPMKNLFLIMLVVSFVTSSFRWMPRAPPPPHLLDTMHWCTGADSYPTLHLKCRSIEVGIWYGLMCWFMCTTNRKQDTCKFCDDNNSRYTEPKHSQHYIAITISFRNCTWFCKKIFCLERWELRCRARMGGEDVPETQTHHLPVWKASLVLSGVWMWD